MGLMQMLALWIVIYFFIGLMSIASVFSYLWIFPVETIPKSLAKLQKHLLDMVMNAPYWFFVNVDIVATLNRSANDMSLIEDDLAGGVVQTLLGTRVCAGATMLTAALRKVGLLDQVNARGGIDSKLSNLMLSQGEMQLFAVAPALLRPGRLLIVDEMTSAVDEHTEESMMEIIQTGFKSSTVIAVAHRLRTIVDFDIVVVMHDGRVVECGSPDDLHGKDRGWFKDIWTSGL